MTYRCIVGSKDPYAHPMTQETKYLFKSIWWDESAKHEVYSHPIVEMFFAKKFHRNRSWLMGLMVMQVSSTLLQCTALVKHQKKIFRYLFIQNRLYFFL